MKKIQFIAYILLLFSIGMVTGCDSPQSSRQQPRAEKGILDLPDWNFITDGPVNLDGEWQFYWEKLLTPDDFTPGDSSEKKSYINLPGLWTDNSIKNCPLPGEGFATYRLRIRNDHDKRLKALHIEGIFSAFNLWINGKPVHRRGRVDKTEEARNQFIFIYHKTTVPFTLESGMNEIVLQILNYHYDSGGINTSIQLEDGREALARQKKNYTIHMVVVGFLFFISFYNIFLYFFLKEDLSPLYFGLFCLVITLNTFNILSPVLHNYFFEASIPFLIDNITVFLNVPLALMMIRALFPEDLSVTVIRLAQIIGAGFTVLLLFSGFKTSLQIIDAYYIFCGIIIAYTIIIFIRIIHNRRDDAFLFFFGFIAVFMTAINDIFYGIGVINTGILYPYGMLILCVSMIVLISRRFSRTFQKVKELSAELEVNNAALTRMNRAKDEFLAITSHELRTPLHGIIGMSESMIAGTTGTLPTEALDNLSLIASSGHRLSNLVNDILDLAKIREDELILNLQPVDLYSLMEIIVRLTEPLVKDKALKIYNRLSPDMPGVMADEDRIRQVMYNLIGNAVKFTLKGEIVISAGDTGTGGREIPDGMVEIRVSDTGIGIAPHDLDTIFESFEQAESSEIRSHAGTGLGLAITRELVELHHGEINVQSEVGSGSTFAFTLQKVPEEKPVIMEAMPSDCMPAAFSSGEDPVLMAADQGVPETISENTPIFLVVDDDPINVRTMENYLSLIDCTIITAPGGIEALNIINENESIDLVLLDIMMPVMSGYEVCRKIRLKYTPDELPVIMVTARNMISDINAAFEAGANDYIVKPFQLHELLRRTETMVKLKNIHRNAATAITLRSRSNDYIFEYRDIIYISSSGRNTIIHTCNEDVEISVLMKEVIDKLPPDIFSRIHRQHMVNVEHVFKIKHIVSGRYRVVLKDDDDTELPVGRVFLPELRRRLQLN